MSDNESTIEEETIEVRFFTNLADPNLKVTEKPFRIPIKLGRYGLSGVINHLLSLEPPKPFEFLVDGEYLRETLLEFCNRDGKSREDTLVLEYTEALSEPSHNADFTHPDWVSAIDTCVTKRIFLSGCFDNVVRVWKVQEGTETKEYEECEISCIGHTNAITSLVNFYENEDQLGFASASKDCRVRVWKADLSTKSASTSHLLKGHTASVQCLDVSPSSSFLNRKSGQMSICTGSWDKLIHIWTLDHQEKGASVESKSGSSKKRKVAAIDVDPSKTLRGHNDCVSAIYWMDQNELISGSWDHKVKVWDIENASETGGFNGNTPVQAISYSPYKRLIASGHSDSKIKMWDIRTPGDAAVDTYTSHKGFVTSVQWHPTNSNHFLSSAHDHTIKIWDARSKYPLATLKDHTDKVFTARWFVEGNESLKASVFSGGADKKVMQHNAMLKPSSE